MSGASARAALAALLALWAGSASAQDRELRLSADTIETLPVVPAGAGTSGLAAIETRILSGDPSKAGPYTISIRVPPNVRIAAHTHKDARSAVVAAGLWHFGYGTSADAAKSVPLPAGSFYTEPAGDPHFAWTGPEGAVVHITGVGPSDTHYTQQENRK
ncbi:MAG TPA: cupin domain-containing protein [Novosphingobium sp.]|nr:cupin domain-containing protein [Novosphingobium sp.]